MAVIAVVQYMIDEFIRLDSYLTTQYITKDHSQYILVRISLFKQPNSTTEPAYLGKAPTTAAAWDGSGANWFKIYELGATFSPFKFLSEGKQ